MLGFLWWLFTGDAVPAIPLALCFELFWLDLYPIGGYAPPMPAYPYLLLLIFASVLGWTEPSSIALPLAVSLPLAYIVPFWEYRQRNRQSEASSRLVAQAEAETFLGGLPARAVMRSALQQLGLGMLLFWGGYACLAGVLATWRIVFARNAYPLDVGWPVLYAVAAVGAFVALRIRRAYITFAFCAVAILIAKTV